MEWISVKKKLPDTRQHVIFWVSGSYAGVRAKSGIFVLNYENEYGKFGSVFIGGDKGFNELHTVTHWMPLPAPPIDPSNPDKK